MMIRRRAARFYEGLLRDVITAAREGEIVQGSHVEAFEEAFAAFVGTRHAAATCSGTNGLDLILDAMGLSSGDGVIIPAYTFRGVGELIRGKGLIPQLVDIEFDSLNMNPDLIEREVDPRTRAIVATHMFGLPCHLGRIREVAARHGLRVIEDCAHSAGAEYEGKKTGAWGDAAFFSFELSKPLNTFGGGMITTDDRGLYDRVKERIVRYPATRSRILKKIGVAYLEALVLKSPLFPLIAYGLASDAGERLIRRLYLSVQGRIRGEVSRFTDLQGRIGLRQLEFLESRNRERARAAAAYDKAFLQRPWRQGSPTEAGRVFHFYVARARHGATAGEVRRAAVGRGVDLGIGEELTHDCCSFSQNPDGYPQASRAFETVLQLPLCDGMRKDDVQRVADRLAGWLLAESVRENRS